MNRYASEYYTVTELPLTSVDKEKIEKDITIYFKLNILLIPLLILIFFWGWIYALIFGTLVLAWNLYAIKHQTTAQKNSELAKIIFTGRVTKMEHVPSGDSTDTILYLGTESFNITYANTHLKIATGDLVSLHYSQNEKGERKLLLSIESNNSL